MRKTRMNVFEVVLVFGLLSLVAAQAMVMHKKAPRVNIFKFFQNQITSVASMFTSLPMFNFHRIEVPQDDGLNGQKVIKPTGGLNVDRLGNGD